MTRISAILLAMLSWAVAAGAQGPPGCSSDVQRFCPEVKPGGGRIMQCLRQHTAELSPDCKDAFVRMGPGGGKQMMRGNPWIKDCEADVAKFCQGVQRGGGRIHACLLGHSGELSPTCRTALEQRPRGGGPAAAPSPAAPATP